MEDFSQMMRDTWKPLILEKGFTRPKYLIYRISQLTYLYTVDDSADIIELIDANSGSPILIAKKYIEKDRITDPSMCIPLVNAVKTDQYKKFRVFNNSLIKTGQKYGGWRKATSELKSQKESFRHLWFFRD